MNEDLYLGNAEEALRHLQESIGLAKTSGALMAYWSAEKARQSLNLYVAALAMKCSEIGPGGT